MARRSPGISGSPPRRKTTKPPTLSQPNQREASDGPPSRLAGAGGHSKYIRLNEKKTRGEKFERTIQTFIRDTAYDESEKYHDAKRFHDVRRVAQREMDRAGPCWTGLRGRKGRVRQMIDFIRPFRTIREEKKFWGAAIRSTVGSVFASNQSLLLRDLVVSNCRNCRECRGAGPRIAPSVCRTGRPGQPQRGDTAVLGVAGGHRGQ